MKKALLILTLAVMMFTACNNYGKKKTFGKGELYYTEQITEEEAQKAGEFLLKNGILSEDRRNSIQLDKADSIYKLRIVVEDKFFTNDSADITFRGISTFMSLEVFDNKPVEVDLCDDQLKTKRTVK